jgi:hypothetical protein
MRPANYHEHDYGYECDRSDNIHIFHPFEVWSLLVYRSLNQSLIILEDGIEWQVHEELPG